MIGWHDLDPPVGEMDPQSAAGSERGHDPAHITGHPRTPPPAHTTDRNHPVADVKHRSLRLPSHIHAPSVDPTAIPEKGSTAHTGKLKGR